MSTRYVYGIYNTTVANRQYTSEESLDVTDTYNYVGVMVCNDYEESVAYNRQGAPVTKYTPTGDNIHYFVSINDYTTGISYYFDTSKYKYIIFYKATNRLDEADAIISDCYLLEYSPSASGAFWHIHILYGKNDGNLRRITVWNNNESGSTTNIRDPMPFYKSGGTISKGSALSSHQSSNLKNLTEGAFLDGELWRWREYQGSDNIDPSAVSYSANDLYSGEPFTITVTPRAPTYGGTVYYRYQYSTNGGSTWTNISSRTTATSATVTLPDGAKQFQARVLASDGWGFTPSTYVYGPAKEVSQLKAYVGINGKAVALKKGYVGVGGKAMQLVKGYVGVGGVAKKLF